TRCPDRAAAIAVLARTVVVPDRPLEAVNKTEWASDSVARVAIAEGTYTTLLKNIDTHVFIARNYDDTRAHREKRKRDESELDPFIDEVLKIEHDIISKNRERANIIINRDYSVTAVDR
ncbi:MAG: hypothetical protein ACWGOV_00060, partial [Acidiferrobacterales bacterium]